MGGRYRASGPEAERASVGAAYLPVTDELITELAKYSLSHIRHLEAESIHVMREVAAEFERPVLLYSVGKDSSVLLRLAQKAFRPGRIPFPLMHVDTGYKFTEMYEFRDWYVKEVGAELIVWRNEAAIARSGTGYAS